MPTITPWWRGRPTIDLHNTIACDELDYDVSVKRGTYGKTARGASSPVKLNKLPVQTAFGIRARAEQHTSNYPGGKQRTR